MTAVSATQLGEDIRRTKDHQTQQPDSERVDYLSQVVLAAHCNFVCYREVATDERTTLPSVLFVSIAGVAWGSVMLQQLGIAGPFVGMVAVVAAWCAVAATVSALAKRRAGASAALPALLRGQSISAFPLLVLPVSLWAGVTVPYLAETIHTLLFGAAMFWLVVGTRAILNVSLPRAIALCAPGPIIEVSDDEA